MYVQGHVAVPFELQAIDRVGMDLETMVHSAAMQQIDTITKVVARIENVRATNAISRSDLLRVFEEMSRAVMRHVTDPEALQAIRADWLEIRLAPDRPER